MCQCWSNVNLDPTKHISITVTSQWGAIASQITSLNIVYSTVYSDADQRKYQSSAPLALCGEFTGTGKFPAQMASNAENVSIWWRHHERNWITSVSGESHWYIHRCWFLCLSVSKFMENVSTYYDATLRIGWTWYMEQFMNLLCCYDHRLDPVVFFCQIRRGCLFSQYN